MLPSCACPNHQQYAFVQRHASVSPRRSFCLQAFDQLHAIGKVNTEDMIIMVECRIHAGKHRSALQMLQHSTVSLSAAAVMPPHKQHELFYIVRKSRSLQKCSPQLLLQLLAVGLQQQIADAKLQISKLVTNCLQDQDVQLAKQVRLVWCLQHLELGCGCNILHTQTCYILDIATCCCSSALRLF